MSMKIYHDGCLGCTQQERMPKGYCYGCQYHKANWNLPDLSRKEAVTKTKVKEESSLNPFKQANKEILDAFKSAEGIRTIKMTASWIVMALVLIVGIQIALPISVWLSGGRGWGIILLLLGIAICIAIDSYIFKVLRIARWV